MSSGTDVAVPVRIYDPSAGWMAGEIALRGQMLHLPIAGRSEAVDLRTVQAALGRWVIFHLGQLRGSVLHLQWATGSICMAGDGVLLPASHYRSPDAEQAELIVRPDDFEELLHQLESRGLHTKPAATAQAGYRDGQGQASAEPLIIAPRGGALGPRHGVTSFLGVFAGLLLGFYLGGWLLQRPMLGSLVGMAVALLPIIVVLIRAVRSLAWRVKRLVLTGRDMHLQASDGSSLVALRAGEVTVRCFHRESRIQAAPGGGTAYSFFFAMMQVDIPGRSKPVFFGTDDPRLGWTGTMETEKDWGAYGFTLNAPEFRAVASALGVAGDLEISDL